MLFRSSIETFGQLPLADSSWQSLDVHQPLPDGPLAAEREAPRHQRFCTDLFGSLCPVTGQPDWATLYVELQDSPWHEARLLGLLLEQRGHTGFHESCIEGLFQRLSRERPEAQLAVYGRFTRRGGIDINPWRSTGHFELPDLRSPRQ